MRVIQQGVSTIFYGDVCTLNRGAKRRKSVLHGGAIHASAYCHHLIKTFMSDLTQWTVRATGLIRVAMMAKL